MGFQQSLMLKGFNNRQNRKERGKMFLGIGKQKQKNENFASKTANYGPWLINFLKFYL